MRAFLAGLILIPALAIAVLSVRPGGLRRQLRQAARRLRITILLGGVYVAVSMVGRLFLGEGTAYEVVVGSAALVLAIVLVALSAERAS